MNIEGVSLKGTMKYSKLKIISRRNNSLIDII